MACECARSKQKIDTMWMILILNEFYLKFGFVLQLESPSSLVPKRQLMFGCHPDNCLIKYIVWKEFDLVSWKKINTNLLYFVIYRKIHFQYNVLHTKVQTRRIAYLTNLLEQQCWAKTWKIILITSIWFLKRVFMQKSRKLQVFTLREN